MSIESTDVTLRKSATVNDTSANGGRMGVAVSVVTTNVKNNVWPDIPLAERIAGSEKYRKLFWHIAPVTTLAATDCLVFLENYKPGDDSVVLMVAATLNAGQVDTQADAVDYTRFYGCAPLDANSSTGATSIDVMVEPGNASGGHEIFKNGDLIRISNKTTLDAAPGSEELLRLAATGGVSWNGNVATLTFAVSGPSCGPLVGTYTTAEGTRVASLHEAGTVEPLMQNWVESGTGTFDEVTYPPIGTSKGSVDDSWTLTFTSSTNYSVTGAVSGSVGSGSVSSDFSPTNTDAGAAYFTIPLLGWGGTWTSGDTVTFDTRPSAIGFWLKRTVPAGAASHVSAPVVPAIIFQSA